METRKNLARGNIKKQLATIATPAALGFLFSTLFNVVDSFFAGQIGTDAIAGMTLAFPVFFILLAIATGIGNGLNALAAIAIGEDNNKKFHSLFKNTIYIAVMFGILIPLFAPFLASGLFTLQGAESDAMYYGLRYVTVVMIGYFFFMINFIFNGILYAQGNSKPFRNFLIVATILNIGLNAVFVLGFWIIPPLDTVG